MNLQGLNPCRWEHGYLTLLLEQSLCCALQLTQEAESPYSTIGSAQPVSAVIYIMPVLSA